MKCGKKSVLLVALALFSSVALSEEQSRAQRLDAKLQERFANADADKNGYVSAAEVDGKMPFVAKNFAAIDTTGRGSVTLDEIRAYAISQKAKRKE